jgi:hypothetical protein
MLHIKMLILLLTGDTNTLPITVPGGGIDCTSAGNGTGAVVFRQSKFAPITSDQSYGKQQAIYLNENVTDIYFSWTRWWHYHN